MQRSEGENVKCAHESFVMSSWQWWAWRMTMWLGFPCDYFDFFVVVVVYSVCSCLYSSSISYLCLHLPCCLLLLSFHVMGATRGFWESANPSNPRRHSPIHRRWCPSYHVFISNGEWMLLQLLKFILLVLSFDWSLQLLQATEGQV